jgi:hypothetical protein
MKISALLYLAVVCLVVRVSHQQERAGAPPQSLLDLRALGDRTSCSRSCQSCMNRTSASNINRKFFFMHIPKTGGLSIEMDIRKIVCDGKFLTKNQCFCGRNHSQFASLHNHTFHYKQSPGAYGWADFSVFSGHEAWGMLPGFVSAAAPVTATMLRDPVARAVSHWNMVAGRSFGFDNSKNVTFSESIRQSISAHGNQEIIGHKHGSSIRNEQLNYLCGIDCPDSLPIREAIKIAKSNLLRTAMVGVHDDIDGFLDQFRAVLPWWPSKEKFRQFSRINSAKEMKNVMKRRHHKRTTVEELDRDALDLLKIFLAPEIELYDFTRKLAAAKTSWSRECAAFALSGGCRGFISDCF